MTDSYLALEGVAYYTDGQPLHRARTMGAGCVATCVLNLMLIVAIGRYSGAQAGNCFLGASAWTSVSALVTCKHVEVLGASHAETLTYVHCSTPPLPVLMQ